MCIIRWKTLPNNTISVKDDQLGTITNTCNTKLSVASNSTLLTEVTYTIQKRASILNSGR
jgi:hypothetical protein